MVDDYSKWDLKIAEWRGYTLKALEDTAEEMKEMKETLRSMRQDIKEIKKANNKRDIKTASIAATVSGLVIVVGYILQSMIS